MRGSPCPENTRILCRYYKDINNGGSTTDRSLAGLCKAFEVKVGVHQGSALITLLFNLGIDVLTKNIPSPLPRTLLYADDNDTAIHLQEVWTHYLFCLLVFRLHLAPTFHGVSVPLTDTLQLLCVELSSNLNFGQYIESKYLTINAHCWT